ncbi:hypothetical protein FOMPIDRAFT_1052894 [Fomitopsis schrenkii]|uniref:Uncharacterized protein n=1 Tax=Fomitopsis schrenkii TaxID=2126942 RepID=S8F5D3_FOMSC|nr:hypothetical protein FOMPIDRAFT_1052894 [Fomitopsis schrenkii]
MDDKYHFKQYAYAHYLFLGKPNGNVVKGAHNISDDCIVNAHFYQYLFVGHSYNVSVSVLSVFTYYFDGDTARVKRIHTEVGVTASTPTQSPIFHNRDSQISPYTFSLCCIGFDCQLYVQQEAEHTGNYLVLWTAFNRCLIRMAHTEAESFPERRAAQFSFREKAADNLGHRHRLRA